MREAQPAGCAFFGFRTEIAVRICPAGRAHCAWGGHFVACIPCLAWMDFGGPPVGRKKRRSDQREDLCSLKRPDKLKGRVNARPTRSGPVRQDIGLYLLRCCVKTSRNLASQVG